jgi:hypothetical protein
MISCGHWHEHVSANNTTASSIACRASTGSRLRLLGGGANVITRSCHPSIRRRPLGKALHKGLLLQQNDCTQQMPCALCPVQHCMQRLHRQPAVRAGGTGGLGSGAYHLSTHRRLPVEGLLPEASPLHTAVTMAIPLPIKDGYNTCRACTGNQLGMLGEQACSWCTHLPLEYTGGCLVRPCYLEGLQLHGTSSMHTCPSPGNI